jgi:hypothetical protein
MTVEMSPSGIRSNSASKSSQRVGRHAAAPDLALGERVVGVAPISVGMSNATDEAALAAFEQVR